MLVEGPVYSRAGQFKDERKSDNNGSKKYSRCCKKDS